MDKIKKKGNHTQKYNSFVTLLKDQKLFYDDKSVLRVQNFPSGYVIKIQMGGNPTVNIWYTPKTTQYILPSIYFCASSLNLHVMRVKSVEIM